MEQLIKQCFGIDIAKHDFTVTLSQKHISGKITFSNSKTFENNKKGFNQFLRWGKKEVNENIFTIFLMEATGIYFEPLAYHLHKIKKEVSVLLPNKVKYYAKSLNIKTKTDAVDSKVIAQLGVERNHPKWIPPQQVFKELRALTRLWSDLKKERTVFLNRLESIDSGEEPNHFLLKANKHLIKELDKHIEKCEQEIKRVVKDESWLAEKIKKLQTIKGVGFNTIVTIVAETQGFALIKNRKQLASYAGYDVVQRESGSSIKGKTRISKKGNSRIRAALHFPALVSSRFNPELKEDYLRINKNKPSKMVGVTALQRKLLLLIYTLWKNDDVYREDVV